MRVNDMFEFIYASIDVLMQMKFESIAVFDLLSMVGVSAGT